MKHENYLLPDITIHEIPENILLPALSRNDIIVMDNMRSHHVKTVKEILDASGIKYFYLPPYSPDLNPIEKMWSKIKAYLSKIKVRTTSELPNTIEKAFSTVSSSDCLGYCRSCNYMQ
ncbi:MAG: transposase [Lachnospiraceae bacterium]|nr:transposase [Robinsoniella sp.]MDY3767693.1 transposase [Lachnospiraceae bacterium]